jgi:SAM-dependent methyltransferase
MKDPIEFYTKLTAEGMSKRKKAEDTKKEITYLKKILNKKQNILDAGCGYGRFTIPLAKQGYNIEGIDITPVLIKKAKQSAKKEKLRINFKLGDIRRLPYKNDSFDAIICMWSVLIEIKNKKDQIKIIKEMLRVLTKKGFALIELPVPVKIKKPVQFMKLGNDDEFVMRKNSYIVRGRLAGINHVTYRYDKHNLIGLMKVGRVKRYKISAINFGNRRRLLVQFWK